MHRNHYCNLKWGQLQWNCIHCIPVNGFSLGARYHSSKRNFTGRNFPVFPGSIVPPFQPKSSCKTQETSVMPNSSMQKPVKYLERANQLSLKQYYTSTNEQSAMKTTAGAQTFTEHYFLPDLHCSSSWLCSPSRNTSSLSCETRLERLSDRYSSAVGSE